MFAPSLASSSRSSEPSLDWSILGDSIADQTRGKDITVDEIVKRVARKLARDSRYRQVLDREDAVQVGRIVTATDAVGARKALDAGNFGWWLRCEILKSDPAGGHRDGGSIHETLAKGFPPVPVRDGQPNPDRFRPGSLDALQDDSKEDDVGDPIRQRPEAVVLGSPRWARIFDAREAWSRAPLTSKQRRALFMRFTLDWTEEEIGQYEGTSRQAAFKHIQLAMRHVRKSFDDSWLTNDDRYRERYMRARSASLAA